LKDGFRWPDANEFLEFLVIPREGVESLRQHQKQTRTGHVIPREGVESLRVGQKKEGETVGRASGDPERGS
jgi:hypothetical protein